MGVTQHISQREGGEQGDPLMPMLFALGQHSSFEAVQGRLRDNEHVLAYHDDVTRRAWVCRRRALVPRAHPVAPREDASVEQRGTGTSRDWSFDQGCDPLLFTSKGKKVLGIPIGQPAFVADFLFFFFWRANPENSKPFS